MAESGRGMDRRTIGQRMADLLLNRQPPLHVEPRHRISGPNGLRICSRCSSEVIEGQFSRMDNREMICASCKRYPDVPPAA